jgi:lipid II:glycine glycyltransferase (peptidoglycan interpeptide bridge formation enzyme)
MLEIRVRSFPRTKVVWFAEKVVRPSRLERLASYQLLFHQVQEKPSEELEKHATISAFTTLLIDLSLNEDVLWKSLRKSTRGDIKAAAASLPHEIEFFHTDPDSHCFDFLTHFCSQKSLPVPNRSSFKKQLHSGIISCCHLDGEIDVLHFHLLDRECSRARLLWSARALEDKARNRTIRLNKLLHWNELLYFKNQLRMLTYDWGGVALTDEALRGVDEFKKGFGGTLVTEWNVSWRSPWYSPLHTRIKQSVLRRVSAR